MDDGSPSIVYRPSSKSRNAFSIRSTKSTRRATMQIATAPVNWNSPDVPEYRPWTPYPALLDVFVQAGYTATERCASMPTDPQRLKADLDAHGLSMLGAFVGVAFRNPEQVEAELARAVELASFLQQVGSRYLIVA